MIGLWSSGGANVFDDFAGGTLGSPSPTPTATPPVASITPTVTVTATPPAGASTRTIAYAYDGLSRLTGAVERGATANSYAYTYDLAGNRTSATVNGVTTSQSYNAANQVVGWSYDAAGNLLNDGAMSYTYDALGRTLSRRVRSGPPLSRERALPRAACQRSRAHPGQYLHRWAMPACRRRP